MNFKKLACLASLAMLMPTLAQAADVKVKIVNDERFQRQELVEIDVKDVRAKLGIDDDETFVVKNGMRQQVDYQITHDGKLLIDAAVKPCGTTTYTIAKGTPEPMRRWVDGNRFPTRKDDIGWENDRGAYRVYGPPLQKSGERSFGIDVWTKNSPELDMRDRYYVDYDGNVRGYELGNGRKDDYTHLHTSFHLDHGRGLDCYGVGPSLGCGAPALMDGDKALAKKVAGLDVAIDQKERSIESMCLKLLLQQQPVARDLRQISAALKMITDMERIGDQAEDIAEIITYLSDRSAANEQLMREMANAAIKMVTDSVDAYVKHDTIMAEKVIAADDVVDAYFDRVKRQLIERIAADPTDGEYALDLLMIAKYFERIADHAVNIAEWVIFSVTGVHKED